jgi:hypothetical protein
LRGLKGNGRLFAACRAIRPGLDALIVAAVISPAANPQLLRPLGFTVLAAFGLVLELLVVEKKLFAGRKDEVCATVNALKDPILEFH